MTAFKELPEYKLGRKYERLVQWWLSSVKGCLVLAPCEYSGEGGSKAPLLYGGSKNVVTPDFLVFNPETKKHFWVEVKAKTKADPDDYDQSLCHGIPLRLWEEYKKVQTETGLYVYLAICEIEPKLSLLIKPIDKIVVHHIYRKNGMSKGGMIFFYRSSFEEAELSGFPND